ncbi:MAG: LolA family protein [Bacillota bacterium]
MKKVFQLFLCIVVATALLAGCGGSKETSGKQDPGAQKASETGSKGGDLKSIFAGAKEIKALSYDMAMTSEGKQMSKGKTWIKEKKSKMEFTSPTGETMVMYADDEKKVAYNYMPDQKMATKIDFAQAQSQTKESPLDYSEEYGKDSAKYKEVGEETVNGYKCKVLEVAEQEGQVKVWVTTEYGIPARVETRAEGKLITMDFTNIKVGDIPDSEFELPAGTQVMDMGQMMKSLPQQ